MSAGLLAVLSSVLPWIHKFEVCSLGLPGNQRSNLFQLPDQWYGHWPNRHTEVFAIAVNLVAALILIVGAVVILSRDSRARPSMIASCSLVLGGVGLLVSLVLVREPATPQLCTAIYSHGIGYWLCGIAGIVGLVAGAMAFQVRLFNRSGSTVNDELQEHQTAG
jgi:hypothetical protein